MSSNSPEVRPIKLGMDTLGERRSPWRDTLWRILHNRSAVVGLIMIGFMLLVALGADIIATHAPNEPMFGKPGEVAPLPRKPPCVPAFGCEEPIHIMGLDQNARDVFSRVVHGSRLSLFVGITVVAFSLTVGVLIGLVAGYFGGWVEDLLMRAMDVLLAFPSLLLAIAIVTILGPGLQNALLAIGIVSVPVYARLARASVLSVKEMEYVTAGRALGAGAGRLMFVNILPNILTPLIVQATLGVGTAVIEAAALSFLGLGAQPPDPEWGQMLSEARALVFTAPHLVFFPGFAITFAVLGFNLLGDGLRDALDPRMRGSN
ncbi:MAG: ABC transporter permease [Anaerolineae bacterium]|nr:ABC transporter permease [Anaerolineae bacterium]